MQSNRRKKKRRKEKKETGPFGDSRRIPGYAPCVDFCQVASLLQKRMYPGCDVVRKKTLLTFVIPETLHVITFLCHTSHIM